MSAAHGLAIMNGMKFSLRSLLLLTILLPPLLAYGWQFVETALTPLEAVYPNRHRAENVSWEQAKKGLTSVGTLGGGFRTDVSQRMTREVPP